MLQFTGWQRVRHDLVAEQQQYIINTITYKYNTLLYIIGRVVSAIDVSDLSKHISSYSKLCKQVKHQENLTCCDAFLVTRNLEHFRENKEHSQINRCPFLSLYGELFTSLVFLNVQSFTVI